MAVQDRLQRETNDKKNDLEVCQGLSNAPACCSTECGVTTTAHLFLYPCLECSALSF